MADRDIHQHIDDLIQRERDLRAALGRGELSREDEQKQLRETEVELDRLWDLLRQRQAKREFGENADEAQLRSAKTVEDYLD